MQRDVHGERDRCRSPGSSRSLVRIQLSKIVWDKARQKCFCRRGGPMFLIRLNQCLGTVLCPNLPVPGLSEQSAAVSLPYPGPRASVPSGQGERHHDVVMDIGSRRAEVEEFLLEISITRKSFRDPEVRRLEHEIECGDKVLIEEHAHNGLATAPDLRRVSQPFAPRLAACALLRCRSDESGQTSCNS